MGIGLKAQRLIVTGSIADRFHAIVALLAYRLEGLHFMACNRLIVIGAYASYGLSGIAL